MDASRMKYLVTAESPEGTPITSFGSWVVEADDGDAAIGVVRHIPSYRNWWPVESQWAVAPLSDRQLLAACKAAEVSR
jgi:hypothetical protein